MAITKSSSIESIIDEMPVKTSDKKKNDLKSGMMNFGNNEPSLKPEIESSEDVHYSKPKTQEISRTEEPKKVLDIFEMPLPTKKEAKSVRKSFLIKERYDEALKKLAKERNQSENALLNDIFEKIFG